MTATTCIGTWVNFGGGYSTSPESDIADFLSGGHPEWREAMEESGAVDRIAEDYRAAIDAVLPEGIALCGDEFIADVDVDYDADEIKEAIEAIDLGEIVERHDEEAIQAATDAIAVAVANRAAAVEQVEAAENSVTEAVREALRLEIPATKVAELLGVTRARVYQIRDGRR